MTLVIEGNFASLGLGSTTIAKLFLSFPTLISFFLNTVPSHSSVAFSFFSLAACLSSSDFLFNNHLESFANRTASAPQSRASQECF